MPHFFALASTLSAAWPCAGGNIPNTGAEYLCVTEDRVYGFEGFINTDKKLVAYDLATGLKLYKTAGLPGHGDQEVPLMADGQGRVFVIRDGTGEVRAYQDSGTGFTLLWTAATATAAALFVTDGTAAGGRLHALSPGLDVLWQQPFPFNYYSGPALGYPGYLAMTGNGTNLVVYRTQGVGTGPGVQSGTIAVFPKPRVDRRSCSGNRGGHEPQGAGHGGKDRSNGDRFS